MGMTKKKFKFPKIFYFCIIFYVVFCLLPTDNNLYVFLRVAFLFLISVTLFTIILGLTSLAKFGTHPYLKTSYNGIKVSFVWRLNGGGAIFANEFVRVVSQKIGKIEHVFEYCAGPGFIGFALLANNLCDRLTLADINPKAIEAIKDTIKNNNLQDKVTVYHADCLDDIPETEQWDLVVSNPPWKLCSKGKKDKKAHILIDQGSRVHKNFYRGICKFLKPNGTILFAEGGEYTDANCFKEMIEKNGLIINESFKAVPFFNILKKMNEYRELKQSFIFTMRFFLSIRDIYFIWSKRKNSSAV